jgi:hypothetical protein
VQEIFLPIRMLLALVSGQDVGIPTVEEIIAGWADLGAAIQSSINNFIALFEGLGGGNIADVVALIQGVIDFINTVLSRLGLSGINSVGGGQVGDLLTPLQNLLGVDSPDVINAITGTNWFTDLTGLLGAPTGLGTGSPTVPGISSIPLLGSLLPVADTSVINAITGTQWFGDLTGILGAPTGLGTGTPTLPGISGIPILGGLFNNGALPWAAPIDILAQAWGGAGSGYLAADLTNFATAIPYPNVQGLLGNSQIGGTVQDFVDTAVQAIQSDFSLFGNTFGILGGSLGRSPASWATPPAAHHRQLRRWPTSPASTTCTSARDLSRRTCQAGLTRQPMSRFRFPTGMAPLSASARAPKSGRLSPPPTVGLKRR